MQADKEREMSGITDNPSETGRAWCEISLDAIRHNVLELKRRLPKSCELMAVVKADAYGHGALRLSEELLRVGVCLFAVATLREALDLRRGGIAGDILVLGRTNPEDARFLSMYKLQQLVADGAHAKALSDTGERLRVHIGIDTGMRRLGIGFDMPCEIESVFNRESLTVIGMATHLSSSDSLSESDISFTKTQIERFFDTVSAMRDKGYDPGKLSVQASYGIYNYPDIHCDFARAGIALYGVMSHNEPVMVTPELRPALSLRARVAEVRWIEAGESVSYGRTFTADRPVKIATVSIGYADGVPRQLSGTGAYVLLRSKRAPVLGRVCMDLTVIDVTEIPDAAAGDIVTVIGADGDEQIRCEDFAERCGTITNDILCRLGARLPRVYL